MSRGTVKGLKWVSGAFEAFLGIPVIGGTFIIANGWTPLLFMLVFHIVIVIFSNKNGNRAYGNILGIITSLLGWIPFVGMAFHMLSALVIFIDAASRSREEMSRPRP